MTATKSESIWTYLLGSLPPDEAAAIEDRYFTDAGYFEQVKAAELRLIAAYWKGTLPTEDRKLFEARYLENPSLRKLVEQHRPTPRFRLDWRMSAAASLALAMTAIFWFRNPAVGPEILLEPGVVKAARERPAIQLPRTGKLALALELPGRIEPLECRSRVFVVRPDGTWDRLPKPETMARTTPIRGGQKLEVLLEPRTLSEGDYVIQVLDARDEVLESYVLRIVQP